jgi:hypothetical protein
MDHSSVGKQFLRNGLEQWLYSWPCKSETEQWEVGTTEDCLRIMRMLQRGPLGRNALKVYDDFPKLALAGTNIEVPKSNVLC